MAKQYTVSVENNSLTMRDHEDGGTATYARASSSSSVTTTSAFPDEGIVLSDEIASILKEKPERIVIGGKKQIKKPMEILLKEFSDSEVIAVSDLDVNYSSAIGAIKIYENKGEASL